MSATRVVNRDVEQGVQLFTHRAENKGSAARFGCQKGLVRRLLLTVFLRGEAGALHKVEDRHWSVLELLARLAGGFQVLACEAWVLLDLLFGVAFHEGALQRPPGDPNQRYPD